MQQVASAWVLQGCPVGLELGGPCWSPARRQTEPVRHVNACWHGVAWFDVPGAMHLPRLAVWTLLNAKKSEFVALLAPVCSSFSAMNVATSCRTPLTPFGDVMKPSVIAGNTLMSRAILLCSLAECLGGVFLLEQPGSSRACFYPRMEWLKRCSLRLYVVAWWARHYGALTPKRHRCWTNSAQVGILDKGKLSKAQRQSCKVVTEQEDRHRCQRDDQGVLLGQSKLEINTVGDLVDRIFMLFHGSEVLSNPVWASFATALAALGCRWCGRAYSGWAWVRFCPGSVPCWAWMFSGRPSQVQEHGVGRPLARGELTCLLPLHEGINSPAGAA